MSIPMRMNLVPVIVKQFSVANTPVDPDFKEPKNGQVKRYGTPLTLKAQVAYQKKDRQETALTGDPATSSGHLCFRKADLDAETVVLKKGDLITSIATFPVNLKIVEVRPSGHLRGKANLVMAYFEQNDETNPSMRR